MKTDPYRRNRGNIVYKNADFNKWKGKPHTFDVVLFSRALHDMRQPRAILSKTHDLLKDGGKIICLEYAYDQMDKRAATWLYVIRRFLDIAAGIRDEAFQKTHGRGSNRSFARILHEKST